MIISSSGTSSVVASSGVNSTGSFSIARTPHMFNILSSGLYSDKIAAVLREVACNAVDAHIMNGTPDLPIEVKLPSTLDKSFYVKDWGTGLSDQELRELYTTYGYSSKQDNQDATGAFGLGSKSPFAYTMQSEDDTDGFSVESAKDGKRSVYTCYIDETGAPAISLIYQGEAEPDWPHGVKVSFPVQARDVTEFHQRAREVFKWFRVPPTVLGLSSGLAAPEFAIKEPFYGLQPSSQQAPALVMGGVRYPIRADRLRDLGPCEEALLRQGNIHLFAPMGAVMMTPSREELEYTERTRTGVMQLLLKAADDLAVKVRETVMKPEATQWEWLKKVQGYYKSLPMGVQVRLDAFLSKAGVSSDDINAVKRAVEANAAVLPSWIGAGSFSAIAVRSQQGPRSEDSLEFVGPPAPLSAIQALKLLPVRVYVYNRESNGRRVGTRVRRREVSRGMVSSGRDWKKLELRYTDNVVVFHSCGKLTDARVRGWVDAAPDRVALLAISREEELDANALMEFAKEIGGENGLHGLPVQSADALPIPPSVLAAKELAKEMRKLGKSSVAVVKSLPLQLMQLSAPAAKPTPTTLGALLDSEKYYVVAGSFDASRSKVRNYDENGAVTHEFSGEDVEDAFGSLSVVINQLGLDISGVVLVPTLSKAKKLKLEEQGLNPLLASVTSAVSKHQEELSGRIPDYRKIDLTNMYYADDYGFTGVLAHHAVLCDKFWTAFMAKPLLAPIALEVLELVRMAEGPTSSSFDNDLFRAISKLNNCFIRGASAFSTVLSSRKTNQSHYEFREMVAKARPMWSAISVPWLVDMTQGDDETNHASALLLLESMMDLDMKTSNLAAVSAPNPEEIVNPVNLTDFCQAA